MGPSPAREGRPIGSAGPTTASRMDKYAPELLDMGLGAMIGKGKRNQAVVDAIIRNGSVYFAAIGGAGALLSKCCLLYTSSMNEDIVINKEGKDLMIGFNPKFLIDALRVIDDEEVDLYLMNAKAPCFIKDEDENYIYLILPVNFNAI